MAYNLTMTAVLSAACADFAQAASSSGPVAIGAMDYFSVLSPIFTTPYTLVNVSKWTLDV